MKNRKADIPSWVLYTVAVMVITIGVILIIYSSANQGYGTQFAKLKNIFGLT